MAGTFLFLAVTKGNQKEPRDLGVPLQKEAARRRTSQYQTSQDQFSFVGERFRSGRSESFKQELSAHVREPFGPADGFLANDM